MRPTFAAREIMKVKNEKLISLADKLKVKPNVVSERLRQDNISISKLDEMLRLMDYKIVLVPRETREQEGWYRVE